MTTTKPKKPGRPRTSSVHVQTEIAQSVVMGIKPPKTVRLKKEHMPFWDEIIKARADWTEIDKVHAANLARCLYDIEINQELLEQETHVIFGGKSGNTLVMNPRHTVIQQLTARALNLSTKLMVHATATVGDAEEVRNKNAHKRKVSEQLGDEDEDLIARPTMQ